MLMVKRTKKILLLTAPRPAPTETPLHFGDGRPPLGLGYVAAYLERAGHQVRIIDLYHFAGEDEKRNPFVEQEELLQLLPINLDSEIVLFQPHFIGMYVHTQSFYEACKLGEKLKAKYPNITLICGGPHPTVLPETMPDYFDHVVVGEGEYVTLDIVERRIKSRIVQGVRVNAMDNLPWPNYDWFIDKPYNWKLKIFGQDTLQPIVSLNTTRGCPYLCRFCGVRAVSGPGFRAISPEVLVSKLIELRGKYDIKGVYFREDNFTTNTSRLEKFCDLLIKRQLRLKWACESRVNNLTEALIKKIAKAGCCGFYIGVESGSPRMLKYMEKDETVEVFLEKFPILHDVGIKTYTTWIFGLPTESQKDRYLSDILIDKLKPTSSDRFVYIGIPKSSFYDQIDFEKSYEYKEPNGIIYPAGYLSLAQQIYGKDDPRYKYVDRIYREANVDSIYINY